MQGNTDHVLSLYGGKETYFRYFFGEAISRLGVLGRGRGGVFVWWEGNLHSVLLRRSNKQGWGCWAGEYENLYSPACPR